MAPAAVATGNLSAWSTRMVGVSLLLPALVTMFVIAVVPRLFQLDVLKRCTRRITSPTVLFAYLYGTVSMTFGIRGSASSSSLGVAYGLTAGLVIFTIYYVFVLDSPQSRRWVLWGLVVGGVVVAVQGLIEYYRVLTAEETYVGVRAAGFWGDPNTFAYALALSSVAAWTLLFQVSSSGSRNRLQRSWTWILMSLLMVFALGVVASVSRSGLLVLTVVTLWNIRLVRRLGNLTLVPLGLAVLAVGLALWNPLGWRALQVMDPRRLVEITRASSDRLNAIWNGLYAFAHAPLTGAGYDASFRWSELMYGTGVYSHNQIAELLASGGLLTFLPWLAFILLQFRESLRPSGDRFPALFIVWFVCVIPFAHFIMYQTYTWVGFALCGKWRD